MQTRIIVVLIACIVGATVYIQAGSGIIRPPYPPPPDGDGPCQLTWLSQRTYAFTVPDAYVPSNPNYQYWNQYSFGSSVPNNAIMALCLLKLTSTGGSDVAFSPNDPGHGGLPTIDDAISPGFVVYSVGPGCDGTVFAYIPCAGRTVWANNPGYVKPVAVYVVGYITQSSSELGYFFDFATHDYPIVMMSGGVSWTNVSVSSIQPPHPSFHLIGLYVAVDSPVYQSIYFRANGDSGAGLQWESDLDEPEMHLLGLIPANDSGFQYHTSGTPINVYVEAFVFSCPASSGDRFTYPQGELLTLITDGAWHTSPYTYNYKALLAAPVQSPGAVNTYRTRASGASNAQIWYKKGSCGSFSILTPLGANKAFEYWSNAMGDTSSNHRIYTGTVALQGS